MTGHEIHHDRHAHAHPHLADDVGEYVGDQEVRHGQEERADNNR